MQKQVHFRIKGMQRDLSASAFSPEYAYENRNIRIMSTDESTLFSMVNERGNLVTDIENIGTSLLGIPIGQAQVDDNWIIFTTAKNVSTDDRIYKLWFNKNSDLEGKILYQGSLGFNTNHPIETLSFYENSDIKKVYWVDGLNQPRVINIEAADEIIQKWTDNSFDFVQRLKLQESVTINRNIVTNGDFSPGVIQYAFTYVNSYAQESNIFYTSPLYYISYNNRGASPEDKVGNSFNITVDYVDTNFEYIRVYSIHRTSIDATPTTKRVVDLLIPEYSRHEVSDIRGVYRADTIEAFKISDGAYVPLESIPYDTNPYGREWNLSWQSYRTVRLTTDGTVIYISNGKTLRVSIQDTPVYTGIRNTDGTYIEVDSYTRIKVTYVDTGKEGDIIDPTELLYVGGEDIIAGTLAQKDNTLFLGDVTLNRNLIDSSIKDYFRTLEPEFYNVDKYIDSPNPSGYYPYDNQLKLSSSQIKTFKYLETYRLGVQFQHYTGKWSEPIWVKDVRNTMHIDASYISQGEIKLPEATAIINSSSVVTSLVEQGYIKVRPVIVYPSLYDKECICQGVLCPTVYNVQDRANSSPFAQSSWFTRINAPFDYTKAFAYESIGEKTNADLYSRTTDVLAVSNQGASDTRAGVMLNGYNNFEYTSDTGSTYPINVDVVNKGTWVEFRHGYPIPDNEDRKAEIQCIENPPENLISSSSSPSTQAEWISSNSINFYVDQSILTFHSPDIEFDTDVRSLDTSNLKLRIVGYVPFTATIGDIDIQTSTPPNNYKDKTIIAPGFYKEPINSTNISRSGFKGVASGIFWLDEFTDSKRSGVDIEKKPVGFVVYPFHRNGSLNNTAFGTDGYKSAMLDKKKISNLRFSFNSHYFDESQIWNAYVSNSQTRTGISGVSIFDSNEVSVIKIPSPIGSSLENITYYGNVDKIITYSARDADGGYFITKSKEVEEDQVLLHNIFRADYTTIKSNESSQIKGTDAISMKYKSTPHAVLALNYSNESSKRVRVLPTLKDGDINPNGDTTIWDINPTSKQSLGSSKFFWESVKVADGVSQDVLNIQIPTSANGSKSGYGPEFGWLWLAELYNDNVQNRFGGQTEDALENNQWLPCGRSVSLVNSTGGVLNSIAIKWEEGDTYYQRYDHLKTYPFTLEDQNAITDIISFMCETRVNLDGRYDRNRGQVSNFAITPTNFNLMNDVYSQTNNFFNYRGVNSKRLNLDNFHNVITWTKTKTAGELVDSWTNVTLASTLDLDGDKGSVRAIRRFNNNLIAFQDKGISQILYNEQTQITSTEGVPIEIANSGKVNGKRYISDKVGCSNKWSICETPNGIYFIDDITKGIFLFNGQLDNISDRLGFHSWINAKSTGINIWDPVNFNGFVTYYDKVNGDVFFISKDECLAFSEPLSQFSSFYSYEHTPYFINLKDKGLALNIANGASVYKVWLHNEGDYNMYFNKYQPFSTTIIANPDMPLDKIFNTLEFRADSWSGNSLLNTTFDTLTTWNEYQSGTSTLNNVIGRPSTLKKKFRIWRANLPRDSSNNRDRMRNPWLYIKLSMEAQNTNKTLLHDMVVHYFE